ncbi:hypothetical protein ACTFIR_011684 [Dictyostelium discoideum]
MDKQISKITIENEFYSVENVRANPHKLFVFGDNNASRGKKGQSIIRGCPNSHGIPTKKHPSLHKSSFYTDKDLKDNIKRIDESIAKLKERSSEYQEIVLPAAGLGTGLARLEECAPKTFEHLQKELNKLKQTI